MNDHDVFISYSTHDHDVAFKICEHLEAAGVRCWMAPRDVRPGFAYSGEIVTAIAAAKLMVLVFTQYANESRQVLREVELASTSGKDIIPLRMQDVTPSKDLLFYLSLPHWLDATSPPLGRHLARLSASIQQRLGKQRQATSARNAIEASPVADEDQLVPAAPLLPSRRGRQRSVLFASALTAILAIAGLTTTLYWQRDRTARITALPAGPVSLTPERLTALDVEQPELYAEQVLGVPSAIEKVAVRCSVEVREATLRRWTDQLHAVETVSLGGGVIILAVRTLRGLADVPYTYAYSDWHLDRSTFSEISEHHMGVYSVGSARTPTYVERHSLGRPGNYHHLYFALYFTRHSDSDFSAADFFETLGIDGDDRSMRRDTAQAQRENYAFMRTRAFPSAVAIANDEGDSCTAGEDDEPLAAIIAGPFWDRPL